MATATIAIPAARVNNIPAVRLKNILFATDFSECSRQALPYVASLARNFDSSVYLFHVVTPSQLVIAAPEAAPYLYEALCNNSTEELTDMARSPELRGLNPKTVLGSGMLEDELVQALKENQIDLVVVGTHGRTGIRRLVLGSSAEKICRIATCPVLTVGPDVVPGSKPQFERILVPTDFSGESTKILPCVLDIARDYGASMLFLHVIPPAANIDARNLAEEARHTLQKVLAKDRSYYQPDFLIKYGHPVETILRAAQENKVDLIAMGIKNTFAPGIQLRSSVAYQVMAGAQCPVLTFRE